MSNKLQELTDRLYQEGLSKGKEEGEALLAKATAQAEELKAAARKEAEAIVAAAEKTAAELISKAESDIKSAAAQSLQATKKDIESLLANAVFSDKLHENLSDGDFLKELISTIAQKFSSEEAVDIALVLPANKQGELEAWVKGELSKTLKKGVSAEFSKKLSAGFTIGPKDGSWYVSLSEETFRELIASYLRPVTKKILFS